MAFHSPYNHTQVTLSVDISLAYRRDAHKAASGVWHFGIQNWSCEAGTVGLGNLQSASGTRLCCTAGTRS